MLIDMFSEGWIEELDDRASGLGPSSQLFLFVDGAFVPGLHKSIGPDRTALLFALLPGCSQSAKDASPFLTPYNPNDKQLRALLQRCNQWPMLSAIETPEALDQLAERLAAWCVVEADGQRFNFRFPDTRRLPAIFGALTPRQRGTFVGPMTRWSYVARDGGWNDLPVDSTGGADAADPILDARQFACLVDDSRADEFLVLLRDRGHDVFRSPSRSHSLLMNGLCAAHASALDDDELFQWCEWFWKQGKLHDDTAAASLLQSWRKEFT